MTGSTANQGRTAVAEPLASFGVAVRFDEGHPVVHVTGEVDLATGPELEGLVAALLDRAHEEIVLDLGDLQFLDGRGLAILARTAERLSSVGGRLTVRAPTPMTQRLLDASNLGTIMHIEPVRPAHGDVLDIAQAAQLPATAEVVRTALLLVVALAEAVVEGADAVTVSLAPDGPLAGVVAIDQEIAALDRDQYTVGQGPCLAAAEHADRFSIDSTANEHRWPAFVPLARARGVNSMLSTPLRGAAGAVGALNMYSFSEHGFSERDKDTAELLARGAFDVLDRGGSDASSAAFAKRVREAVAGRHTIALAQGILMGRDRRSADGAYTALRRESVQTSRPLRDIAATVVSAAEGGATDDPLGR